MNTMITRVRNFLTSEDGPTAVEYAVLVGLIAVALAASIPMLTSSISTAFSQVSSTISGGGSTSGS
jgi:pilus assembly protein Flp/PilA